MKLRTKTTTIWVSYLMNLFTPFITIMAIIFVENGEIEKLNNELPEPTHKNASTMVSFERLHIMIEYNQIGSLSTLSRMSKSETHNFMRARSTSIRRGSYSTGMFKTQRSSASRIEGIKFYDHEKNNSRNSMKNSGSLLSRQGNNSVGKVSCTLKILLEQRTERACEAKLMVTHDRVPIGRTQMLIIYKQIVPEFSRKYFLLPVALQSDVALDDLSWASTTQFLTFFKVFCPL